jgi:hypothetical protein
MAAEGRGPSKAHRRTRVVQRRMAQEAERAAFDALRAQYGLQIPGLSALAVSAMLRALDAVRYQALDDRGLIPCRARLLDGTLVDPCLVWLSEWGAMGFMDNPRKLVGGHVARLLRSEYTLPFRIIEAARHTREYRMGAYVPVLVSIGGAARYLVPAGSFFFRCGEYKGKDVDPDFVAEPSEKLHRLGRYVWGDDMIAQTTAIALERPNGSGG